MRRVYANNTTAGDGYNLYVNVIFVKYITIYKLFIKDQFYGMGYLPMLSNVRL